MLTKLIKSTKLLISAHLITVRTAICKTRQWQFIFCEKAGISFMGNIIY